MSPNRALAITLAILGVVLAGAAIFYVTQKTSFLSSGRPAHHFDRGLAVGAVALVVLIAAYLVRPRAARA